MLTSSQNFQQISIQTDQLTLKGIASQSQAFNTTPIFAIHGWQDNCHSFIPLMTQLTEHHWTCIDLPGHGQSDWRHHSAHYYFVDYIQDIYLSIKQRYDEPIILVGHSMGAMLSTLFAATFPELVKSVVLIEGIGLVTTPPEEVCLQLRQAITKRIKHNTKQVNKTRMLDDLIKARMAVSDLNYQDAKLLMQRNTKQVQQHTYLTIDPKLKQNSGFRFDQLQTREICSKVKCKVLFLLAKDGLNSINIAYKNYHQDYKKLEMTEVAGGHHCHIESPEIVAKQIKLFLQS